MYLNAVYCTAASSLRGDLEPPRPFCVTRCHITLTQSPGGCFPRPLYPQVTHWILVEVLSPPPHPCLPLGEPRLCSGWNPCMEPEPPLNCFGKVFVSPPGLGAHKGLVKDCGATWARGAGAAAACWRCQGVGRSRVNAGGGSALRHPGFLGSPSSPWPVSSFAWPAMAAIPWCTEGK